MLNNYIKTLLLSTIVFVIGNNSNYCYSMEDYNVQEQVHNTDQYGINRTVNGWAIPDKDANGNIIENEHFLQDGYYLSNEIVNQQNNLEQNNTQQLQQFLYHISSNFYLRYHLICNTLKMESETPGLAEQQFKRNTIMSKMHGFIPQDILNQYDNITFGQLSNYLSNKICFIMINNIRQIQNIINAWNGQNIDELRYQIMKKIANCHYTIQNIINTFLNFCNNSLDQNSVTQIRNSIDFFMNLLQQFAQQNNLENYIRYSDFLDQIEKIEQIINNNDDLINCNLNEECNNAMFYLRNEFNSIKPNFQKEANLIEEFWKFYNSIVGRIDNDVFLRGCYNDFQDSYDITNTNLVDNAVVFGKQLTIDVTFHVIQMLINIKDLILQNNLTSQQLKTTVSHYIDNVISSSNNVLLQLTKENNALANAFQNNNGGFTIDKEVQFFTEATKNLYNIKQKYNLP